MPHDGAMQRTFGRRTFDFSRAAAVMAIINRTPDSFYDRGADFALDAALATADRALAEGADWLDVGGVKAGPGPEVDETEELERVLPVVEALRPRTDAVISVDTFRSGVARAARAQTRQGRRRAGRSTRAVAPRRAAPHAAAPQPLTGPAGRRQGLP